MRDTIARSVICVMLVLSQVGCRSVYRFRCTCNRPVAGVVICEEMVGETPCSVEIPRDSDWIQDDRIEFTFCLPDGREKKEIVDLHGLKPSNPAAEIVAAPFLLTGAIMLLLATDEDDDEEDSGFASHEHEEKDDDGDKLLTGLAGVGMAVTGMGLYHLLGGDSDSLAPREVHADFDEPANRQEPPAQ